MSQDLNSRPLCSMHMIRQESHNLFSYLCWLISDFKRGNDVITRDSAALTVNHYKQEV